MGRPPAPPGYDALALSTGCSSTRPGRGRSARSTTRLRGAPVDWPEMVHDTKRAVADGILRSGGAPHRPRAARATSSAGRARPTLEDAVAELLACFPVYRSYLPERREHLDARVRRGPRAPARPGRDARRAARRCSPTRAQPAALRFQQTSGMVMAKGVEDCAFYRCARLTSLNEVGGDPSVFSRRPPTSSTTRWPPRQREWPHAMTALSTHDTKRGEDVRARIARARRDPRRVGARRSTGCSTLVPAARPRLRQPALAGGRRRLAGSSDARAAARLRREGDARGRRPDARGPTPTRPTRRPCTRPSTPLRRRRGARRARRGARRRRRPPAGATRWPPSCSRSRCRACPTSTRAASCGSRASSTPTTAGRSTSTYARSLLHAVEPASARADRRASTTGRGQAAGHPRRALRPRRDQPELFDAYAPLPPPGRPPTTCSPSTAAGRVTVGDPAAASASPHAAAGATPRSPLPAGAWIDLLSPVASGSRATVAARASCSPAYPVALLVRDDRRGRSTGADASTSGHRARESTVRSAVADARRRRWRAGDDGWWTPDRAGARSARSTTATSSTRGDAVPDPRSRRQPDGVHGRSRTFDPGAFAWTDDALDRPPARRLGRSTSCTSARSRPRARSTRRSTGSTTCGRSASTSSSCCRSTRSTAPTAGATTASLWFAVHEPYGGPAAYQRFVDACHAAGLGVIQDVVYNHLGPSGNYLPRSARTSPRAPTPWGDLVNLDGEGSDEVRALHPRQRADVAGGLPRRRAAARRRARARRRLARRTCSRRWPSRWPRCRPHQRRPLTLIAESDLNDPHLVTPREAGGYGLDAQWSDDFHHAVHVALTGETERLLRRLRAARRRWPRCASRGSSTTARGRRSATASTACRSTPSACPRWRLVVCNQNHDQVGNRARGDRIAETLDDDQLACAALLTLAGPFTPMLFQGEEWAASTPFAFFTSHPEDGARPGRGRGPARGVRADGLGPESVPDPQDPATFAASKLDWSELETGRHAVLLDVYRELAALRRAHARADRPGHAHDLLRRRRGRRAGS